MASAATLSGKDYAATKLAPEDQWIEKLDIDAFRDEIKQLGKQLAEQQGEKDVAHLRKIVWWSRLSQWVGALTMWYCVNPVSIFLLSLGCMTRWTCIGHHVCHGGYDKADTGGRYNRFRFGVGSVYRRATDWLDWMLVEAWNCEHNQLHHYYLGEDEDPDLVEENLRILREMNASRPVKLLAAGVMMGIWKWWYYAPNTFKVLKVNELRRAGKPLPAHPTHGGAYACTIDPDWLIHGPVFFSAAEFFVRVLAPYFALRFLLLPGAFGVLLGSAAFRNSLVTLLLAEVLTNLHAFLNIVTNHAGDDLYRFQAHCKPKSGTFYLRQVISSVNFRTGAPHTTLGDLNDFLHGWLNYQIEHHLWPQLSMLSYQRAAPEVKKICAKHGVPYVQQNVFRRLKATADIMVGATSMRYFRPEWDRPEDKFAWK
eukprot:Transcript_8678.p1 GENE.Transcript_8678~~Transcript_8678.p1  ORF type:complete len:425 (-),score=241.17 Transcript_8678:222-1496(-)